MRSPLKSLRFRSLRLINPASLTLGILVLVASLYFSEVPILDLFELKAYDVRLRSRGPLPPSPGVVMAVIDEKSLGAEGRWPWPRSKIAALVDVLSQDGARVIAFDIAFTEPDENSQLALIDELTRQVDALAIKDPQLTDILAQNRKGADHDRVLAEAIQRSSARVVLGYFFHMSEAELSYRIEQPEID
ncbi:MAG TPA: CHASE2 domain-containing protein, partial [Thermoanaerobaculia bacterium]|nr:CHASE2 domain-containing protein [Thermoanaerobaculia bacterium]